MDADAPSAATAVFSTKTPIAVGGASGRVAETVTVKIPDAARPSAFSTVYLIGKTPSVSGAGTTTVSSTTSAVIPAGTTRPGSANVNGVLPPGSVAAPSASIPTVRPGRTTTARSGATGGSATAGGEMTATRTDPFTCLPNGSAAR